MCGMGETKYIASIVGFISRLSSMRSMSRRRQRWAGPGVRVRRRASTYWRYSG